MPVSTTASGAKDRGTRTRAEARRRPCRSCPNPRSRFENFESVPDRPFRFAFSPPCRLLRNPAENNRSFPKPMKALSEIQLSEISGGSSEFPIAPPGPAFDAPSAPSVNSATWLLLMKSLEIPGPNTKLC